ncbi:LamG-like jellyroll fold domain-containing protein [Rhodopirellula sallentina]|uniref:FecR protein domain protein n=1 Tax=Rhodopirellula sallentina SM41 TaxID=1263870 RepID=M5U5Z6_9BACT|nr:LamG-like jellyroll fold domain-containing protein [Rhodopirellula sallentina]EMI53271.1 FecR protein domain protein [Rhodopirellula sallentina SM41]
MDRRKEFERLLQSALSGSLSRQDALRAQELMRADREFLEEWVDHFRLDSILQEELDGAAIVDLVDLVSSSGGPGEVGLRERRGEDVRGGLARQAARASQTSGLKWALAGVCVLAAGLLLMFVWQSPRTRPVTKQLPVPDETIAMIAQTSGDVWREDNVPPMKLPPGRLQLDSGFAEIRVYNGVTLFLEGPVDLDLLSLDRAHLREGKLRASVPDGAEGFSVTTDSVRLVDRGTEFAISSAADGVSKIHVIDGLVDVFPKDVGNTSDNEFGKSLVEGESVEVGPTFGLREASFDLFGFPSASAIDESVSARYRRWQQWSEEFSRRSDLVVYFNFEEGDKQLLSRQGVTNLATVQGLEVKATVVGCEVVPGRWPQKQALGFYNTTDRIRVRVPGRYPQLTFACWVRVDELRGVNQALLLTDVFDSWRPHWQIARQGDLKLGIGQSSVKLSRQMQTGSTPLVSLSPLGRWTHLATTYDSQSKTVRHFVNGTQTAWNRLPRAEPLRIGAAEIGNWLRPRKTGDEPIRNLDGRIDEFVLLSTALHPEEIQEIFEAGR